MIRHPVRVGYVDTDQGGIVHHSVYLRWLEQARVELLRANGLDFRALEYDTKLTLPVARVSLRYLRPARFDEQLVVECTLAHVGRASLRFDYRVLRDELLLTEAQITLACVKLPEGHATAVPTVFRDLLDK